MADMLEIADHLPSRTLADVALDSVSGQQSEPQSAMDPRKQADQPELDMETANETETSKTQDNGLPGQSSKVQKDPTTVSLKSRTAPKSPHATELLKNAPPIENSDYTSSSTHSLAHRSAPAMAVYLGLLSKHDLELYLASPAFLPAIIAINRVPELRKWEGLKLPIKKAMSFLEAPAVKDEFQPIDGLDAAVKAYRDSWINGKHGVCKLLAYILQRLVGPTIGFYDQSKTDQDKFQSWLEEHCQKCLGSGPNVSGLDTGRGTAKPNWYHDEDKSPEAEAYHRAFQSLKYFSRSGGFEISKGDFEPELLRLWEKPAWTTAKFLYSVDQHAPGWMR